MNGLQKTTIETSVETVLEDVDNCATFPANGDVAEADAVVVERFCITTRIRGKDSLLNAWEEAAARSCWDMIKEGEDVAVVERGEELVLEGDETGESPSDSNKTT